MARGTDMGTKGAMTGVLIAALLGWCGNAAALGFAFSPDPARATGISPEGCYVEPGAARGTLATEAPTGTCHAGTAGGATSVVVFAGGYYAEVPAPAEFVSAPLPNGVALAGPATLRVYYINPARQDESHVDAMVTRLDYALDELRADGTAVDLAHGVAIDYLHNHSHVLGPYSTEPLGQTAVFDVGRHALGAGSQLRLTLRTVNRNGAGTPEAVPGYLLFGGKSLYAGAGAPLEGDFGDAGITFETAEAKSAGNLATGAPAPGFILALLGLALIRRCYPRVRAKSFM